MLILDGGMGTELENRGIDCSDPLWLTLWSAKFLLPINSDFLKCIESADPWTVDQLEKVNRALDEHPEWLESSQDNSNLLYRIHKDYVVAGADIVTSASYQASLEGTIKAGAVQRWPEALWMLRKSEQLVRKAVTEAKVKRKVLLAASVGPFGAWLGGGQEYNGDYTGYTKDDIRRHHEFKIRAVLGGSPDMLLIETIPSIIEVEVLVDVLNTILPPSAIPVCLSLSVKSADYDRVALADGSELSNIAELAASCPSFTHLGVNCCAETVAKLSLDILQQHTSLQLIVYPNSGEVYDGATKTWSGNCDSSFLEAATLSDWQTSVSILGGCCRTGPPHIAFLRHKVDGFLS
ncbi:Homocysteine S-methyltransferase [Yarrowia lipolytica]|jgi:homocysteine S-methyltransferase|uniref:Homocysteine S-methyltransferase n=1 Tax=Yarrowia lipolytica TaxID=4952 RepID=A0A371C6W5_YARLL|nr:Homocysteine S-methyltransferase [Yarrowia lipolytica]RDW26047.1 Homocysteine S-methyltransferase [Yarrowia lipolytica]RDW35587.1 Homocysteine S-methyltransferase [Yarrowia lipolytica]RDW41945.1 Homocysteine S-methyltransferase [Yarrowia lipolytica]RDW46432.1 Homocysteine S-methyltransferase [Yarrowia lipolytica]